MKGCWIRYSDDELAWLEERRDWPRATLRELFALLFERPDVKVDDIKSLCARKGWKTGRTGQFAKGAVPANKGKPCPAGVGGRHPNAVRTQFRKGERAPQAARNYKPIGTERVTRDGYRERKIHDGLPLQSRWRAVHLIEWEERHGPIAAGHCLKCLNGDKGHSDPLNWELIPRAMLPRLNGGTHRRLPAYDEVAPELRPTLLAVAKVEHLVRLRRKAAA
jgi:hypothetical protein